MVSGVGVGDGVGFGVRVGVSTAASSVGRRRTGGCRLPGRAATAIAPPTMPSKARRAMRTVFGARRGPGLLARGHDGPGTRRAGRSLRPARGGGSPDNDGRGDDRRGTRVIGGVDRCLRVRPPSHCRSHSGRPARAPRLDGRRASRSRGHLGADGPRRGRDRADPGEGDRVGRVAAERTRPGQCLVQDEPETVDIGGRGRRRALGLLGAEVVDRTERGSRPCAPPRRRRAARCRSR